MPCGTSGSAANSPTDSSSDPSRRLNGGLRRRTGVPISTVSARSGAAVSSASAPGCSSRNSAAVLARNGRWSGNCSIPASSVAGPSVIDSWMNGATLRRAPNVASRLTNSCACDSAAGATIAAVRASERTNRGRSVSGLARLRATGMTSRSSGRNAPIAWLMLEPRPASASPNPLRFTRAAARVSSSNMFTNSSNSTGAGRGVARAGSWRRRRSPRPTSRGWICRYLRPSAERGRTISVESTGSGSTERSSLSESSAMFWPSSRRSTPIRSIEPTRVPPIRTSFPRTRLAALGSSAFRL